MVNKKLSFIVPVYNVAPYLRKCVDSLLVQDYADYEIILVDDGSTDESGAICDEYAASSLSAAGTSPFSEADHSIIPIRVIHQVNAGLSAARNSGILAECGEYLCFVDSDDYWQPNVLGSLMAQVERENLDVLRFDYQNVRVADGVQCTVYGIEYEVFQPYKHPHQPDSQHAIVDGESYLNTRMGYACYAWQFILRRDLIYTVHHTPYTENNALFSEGLHFEDVDWLPRMMLRAKRVNGTQTIVYNYFWREGSITLTQGNKEKIRKNVEDQLYIIEQYKDYLEYHPLCTWLKNMQSNMVAGVLTAVAREFYAERLEYINRIKKLDVFPLSIANQGQTYTRRANLINMLGPNIFCILMHFR